MTELVGGRHAAEDGFIRAHVEASVRGRHAGDDGFIRAHGALQQDQPVGGRHAGDSIAPFIKNALQILFLLTLFLTQSTTFAQDRPPQYIPGQSSAPSGTPPQAQQQPETIPGQDALSSPIPALGASDSTYRLASGDIVRVNVFNQPELSGEYQLDGNAQFVMPLIGRIDAKDLTSAELEILLVAKLKPDYLVNPRIFVQVLNYRPYYLIGEAGATGAFPYVAGMTYLVAIAKSGGFSYRAKKKYVYVIRADDPEQNEIKMSIDEFVQPGDIIRVAERLF